MFKKKKNEPTLAELSQRYRAKIVIYRDAASLFRWRLLGSNGRIMADSAEGYSDRQHCREAVARFKAIAQNAKVTESSEDLKA